MYGIYRMHLSELNGTHGTEVCLKEISRNLPDRYFEDEDCVTATELKTVKPSAF